MKVQRLFLISLTLLVMALTSAEVAAQRSGWSTQMLEYKHDFISKEVGLSPSQKKEFLPLYEAMENEIYQVNREARDLAKKVGEKKASDKEYYEAAQALSKVKVKEGEIETRYFDKFSKILTKEQMFLLKRAEIRFTRKMIEKNK